MFTIETCRTKVKKTPTQDYTAEFKEQAVQHAKVAGIMVTAKVNQLQVVWFDRIPVDQGRLQTTRSWFNF